MAASKIVKEWLQWVNLTSIPLRKLAADQSPIGIASGTLIDCLDRRFLLTVSHAVESTSTNWVIEIGFDPGHGTDVYKPRQFSYLAEFEKPNSILTNVDYAYAEIPVDVLPTFQMLTPRGPQTEKIPRHVFAELDIREPDSDSIYGFAGCVYRRR